MRTDKADRPHKQHAEQCSRLAQSFERKQSKREWETTRNKARKAKETR